ncbi:unnamed protein product, partial [marine sediment metagenome]
MGKVLDIYKAKIQLSRETIHIHQKIKSTKQNI